MEDFILKKWRKYAETNYERQTRDFAAFLLYGCSTGLQSDDDDSQSEKEMLRNRVSLLERDSAKMQSSIEELKRKLEAKESMDNTDNTGKGKEGVFDKGKRKWNDQKGGSVKRNTGDVLLPLFGNDDFSDSDQDEIEGRTEKKQRKYSERSNDGELIFSGPSSPTGMCSGRCNEREYTCSPIRMHSKRSNMSENTYSPIQMHAERSSERESYSPVQKLNHIGSNSNEEEYDIINKEMRREEKHAKLVSLLKRDSAEMGNRIEVLQRKLQVLESIEGEVNKGIRIQLKHDQMCNKLQEKNEELLDLKHEVIAKEQLNHNELLEVRKELIKGFSDAKKTRPKEVIPFIFKQKSLEMKKVPIAYESQVGKEETSKDEENVNVVSGRSDDVMAEQAESKEKPTESEQGPNEDKGKKQKSSAKNASSVAKSIAKEEVKIAKKPITKKFAAEESTAKNVVLKVKEKTNFEELRNAISKILKDVDFNTTTFSDILNLLSKQFDTDLPRKCLIKSMIQDELGKLS